MLGISVDLGSIKVAGKRPNLSLTLSTSFSIIMPPSWRAIPTAEELRLAFSTGKIWISKAGSCQIDVLSLVNGEVPTTASFDASIIAAIANFTSECPVSRPLLHDADSSDLSGLATHGARPSNEPRFPLSTRPEARTSLILPSSSRPFIRDDCTSGRAFCPV